jgi:hypothetical protein
MDFFRKLFEFIASMGDDIFDEQVYMLDNDGAEEDASVVTVHPDDTGNLVFSVFTLDEWEMIDDISELTGKDKFDIIQGLAEEDTIKTWVLDPKEFPNDFED